MLRGIAQTAVYEASSRGHKMPKKGGDANVGLLSSEEASRPATPSLISPDYSSEREGSTNDAFLLGGSLGKEDGGQGLLVMAEPAATYPTQNVNNIISGPTPVAAHDMEGRASPSSPIPEMPQDLLALMIADGLQPHEMQTLFTDNFVQTAEVYKKMQHSHFANSGIDIKKRREAIAREQKLEEIRQFLTPPGCQVLERSEISAQGLDAIIQGQSHMLNPSIYSDLPVVDQLVIDEKRDRRQAGQDLEQSRKEKELELEHERQLAQLSKEEMDQLADLNRQVGCLACCACAMGILCSPFACLGACCSRCE